MGYGSYMRGPELVLELELELELELIQALARIMDHPSCEFLAEFIDKLFEIGGRWRFVFLRSWAITGLSLSCQWCCGM
jgi:hypothetical protein